MKCRIISYKISMYACMHTTGNRNELEYVLCLFVILSISHHIVSFLWMSWTSKPYTILWTRVLGNRQEQHRHIIQHPLPCFCYCVNQKQTSSQRRRLNISTFYGTTIESVVFLQPTTSVSMYNSLHAGGNILRIIFVGYPKLTISKYRKSFY